MEKDFADFNPSQTAYEKRIAELEAIDEKNTANLRRFQATLIEWKDKNNELSRKNSELEARLKESEDMADASLLAVNEKQSEIFKQQSVIDLQRDKIAGLEAELTQLKDGKSHVVGVEIPEGYLEEAFKNVAPVAKPIVWEDFTDSDGSHELRAEIGANMRFRITSQCNDKVKQLLLIKYYNDYSVLDDHMFIGNFEEVEAAKQFAQDWLNKLVAECAVLKVPNSAGLNPSNSRGLKTNFSVKSKSSTCKENLQVPQFTAEEIDLIRKMAKYGMGGYDFRCQQLAAKCDAMLKGAQR